MRGLDDREQDEHDVQRQRRSSEEDDRQPLRPRRSSGPRRETVAVVVLMRLLVSRVRVERAGGEAGPLACGPWLASERGGVYWAAAASVMAWQTFAGVDMPRNRPTVASLIAVPMAGEVAWSR